MAGLKKPTQCPCGGTELKREFDPERWVCTACTTVVRTRQSKPDQNSGRVCGAARGTKPFKVKKNLCLECARQVHTDWKKNNAEHLKEYRSQPEFRRKRAIAVKKAVQRSPEAFIRYLARALGRPSNKSQRSDG